VANDDGVLATSGTRSDSRSAILVAP
jgi:hypothetical protein